MLVGFKVLCNFFDTSRQDRYLRLWATDIVLADLSQSNRFLLVVFSNHPDNCNKLSTVLQVATLLRRDELMIGRVDLFQSYP